MSQSILIFVLILVILVSFTRADYYTIPPCQKCDTPKFQQPPPPSPSKIIKCNNPFFYMRRSGYEYRTADLREDNNCDDPNSRCPFDKLTDAAKFRRAQTEKGIKEFRWTARMGHLRREFTEQMEPEFGKDSFEFKARHETCNSDAKKVLDLFIQEKCSEWSFEELVVEKEWTSYLVRPLQI